MNRPSSQIVTTEDSTTCIHASRRQHGPASEHLLSEPRFIAEIVKDALNADRRIPWDDWAPDYALVRDEIAHMLPGDFHDFNQRLDSGRLSAVHRAA